MSTTQTQQGREAQQVTQQAGKLAPEQKVEESKVATSAGSKQQPQQAGPLARRADEGTIRVRDIFDKELMAVGKDDIAKRNIGWLRDNMLRQMESVRGMSKELGRGEELYVYSTFGSWYGDETPLNEVRGDLKYFRRGPHEGKYEMTVSLPDQRQVNVEVDDNSTVADVKKQVAERTIPRVDPWRSILSFQQRALLDDFATLGALRLPRVGYFDLLW